MSVLPVGFGSQGGGGGVVIDKALRLISAASSNLTRTFAAGDRRTWTYKISAKRGARDFADGPLFNAGGNGFIFRFSSGGAANNFIEVYQFNGVTFDFRLVTNERFVDTAGYYELQVVLDTNNATSTDRVRLYVNGTRITSFSTASYPSLGFQASINTAASHAIGTVVGIGGFYEGLIADVQFVDGLALNPSSFGVNDPTTGVWVPKAYTGPYGTTGFHLDFANGSSLANLTADASGNGNNWTANNISLTAGVDYAWIDDTPTDNFAVLNAQNRNSSSTFSRSLTRATFGSVTFIPAISNFGVSSGKWYWEVTLTTIVTASNFIMVGADRPGRPAASGTFPGDTGSGFAYYSANGNKYLNNVATAYGATFATGDVIGVALDMDAGEVTFYKNNVSQGVAFTGLSSEYTPAFSVLNNAAAIDINYGARPFLYTPPSGFVAISTQSTGNVAPISSGSFTGNANVDGPFVWLGGTPDTMTINGNAVTFGTHADRLANGIKIITASTSYNTAGSNTFSVTSFIDDFTDPNRAKGNP